MSLLNSINLCSVFYLYQKFNNHRAKL